MKKLLAVLACTMLLLGIGADVFAGTVGVGSDADVTLTGFMRLRGWYQNDTDTNADNEDRYSVYDRLVRLGTNYKFSDGVNGRIELEEYVLWGATASAATGTYTAGNRTGGSIYVREAWVNYDPGAVGVKAGHMLLSLGNKLFFDHTRYGDDALVVYTDPSDQLHIGGLTAKLSEGGSGNYKDIDAYVVLATYKAGNLTASGDLSYVRHQDMVAAQDGDLTLMNIGLRGAMAMDAINFGGDIEFQSGTAEKAAVGGGDLEYGGYAILLDASMKLASVTPKLQIGMGTGDEDASDDAMDTFITSLSGGVDYFDQYVYQGKMRQASGGTAPSGISNLTFIKIAADTKINDISLMAAFNYLKATEEVMTAALNKTDDLGMELDLKASTMLAKNLQYYIEAGYLMVGDVFEKGDGTSGDDAVLVRHGLIVTF